MKTKLIILGVVLAAILGGWYFVSPGYSMMQLRNAAEAADEAELAERIDFPAVRQSLKDDLKARMASEMGGRDTDGLEGFGAMMATAMIDPMIDGLVTPQSVAKLVEDGKIGGSGAEVLGGMAGIPTGDDAGGGAMLPNGEEQPPEWEIVRDGISGFTASPKSRETGMVDPRSPALQFERDGLGWRLVAIDIPEGG